MPQVFDLAHVFIAKALHTFARHALGSARNCGSFFANEDHGMSIEDIAARLKSRVESGSFDSSVKFDTGKDGVIVINGNTISTTDGPADCTIKLSLSDFEDMLSGELSPTSAFMSGKLQIEGDMSVAMSLQQFL
jgi:putative sterol carrier protein